MFALPCHGQRRIGKKKNKICASRLRLKWKRKRRLRCTTHEKKHSWVWSGLVRQHTWQPRTHSRAYSNTLHLKSEKNIVFFSQLIVVVSIVVCVDSIDDRIRTSNANIVVFFFHTKFWTRYQATPEKFRSQAMKLNRAWAWPIEWHGRVEFNHSKYQSEKKTLTRRHHTRSNNNKKFLTRQTRSPAKQIDQQNDFSMARKHNNRLIFVYFPSSTRQWASNGFRL